METRKDPSNQIDFVSESDELDRAFEDDFPEPVDSPLGIISTPQNKLKDSKVGRDNVKPERNEKSFSDRNITYLIMGGWLYASQAFKTHSKSVQDQFSTTDQQHVVFDHENDEEDILTNALVGFAISAPQAVSRRIHRVSVYLNSLFTTTGRLIHPVINNPISRPFAKGFDRLVQRGEEIVQDYADIGRQEKIISQKYTKQSVEKLVDSTVDTVASRPEIRELVQQQSMSLAEEFTSEFQERVAAADSLLERIIFKLIPRVKKDTTPLLDLPVEQDAFIRLKTLLKLEEKVH